VDICTRSCRPSSLFFAGQRTAASNSVILRYLLVTVVPRAGAGTPDTLSAIITSLAVSVMPMVTGEQELVSPPTDLQYTDFGHPDFGHPGF
jgi:hypothetical protein